MTQPIEMLPKRAPRSTLRRYHTADVHPVTPGTFNGLYGLLNRYGMISNEG